MGQMQRFMGFIQRLLKKTAIVSAACLRGLCNGPQALMPTWRALHCTRTDSSTHERTHSRGGMASV